MHRPREVFATVFSHAIICLRRTGSNIQHVDALYSRGRRNVAKSVPYYQNSSPCANKEAVLRGVQFESHTTQINTSFARHGKQKTSLERKILVESPQKTHQVTAFSERYIRAHILHVPSSDPRERSKFEFFYTTTTLLVWYPVPGNFYSRTVMPPRVTKIRVVTKQ